MARMSVVVVVINRFVGDAQMLGHPFPKQKPLFRVLTGKVKGGGARVQAITVSEVWQ